MTKSAKTNKQELWIGLLSLVPMDRSPVLLGGTGAYSNLIARAADPESFDVAARQSAAELGLTVVEILWAEPLVVRLSKHCLEENLSVIAELVDVDGCARFGTLHTWSEDDLSS